MFHFVEAIIAQDGMFGFTSCMQTSLVAAAVIVHTLYKSVLLLLFETLFFK